MQIELTTQQKISFEKIKTFMDSDASIFILRGYAGTGKTTMIKVVSDFIAQTREVVLMAPTGRAARVLSQKTNRKASTIHRAIYGMAAIETEKSEDIADIEFKYIFPINKNDKKIVAIIDEASMLCSRTIRQEIFQFGTGNLMDDLISFVRPSYGGKLIFVGDPAQLPPVGESISNALNKEFFEGKGLKVMSSELTEVLRQTGESIILKNAMQIRNLLNSKKRNQLFFNEKAGEVVTVERGRLLESFLADRRESNSNNSVLICFSNQSAYNYNMEIRESLYGVPNPPLRVNDILMIAHNNYTLDRMNGEFVPVLEVGITTRLSAPVMVQQGEKRERQIITLDFISIKILNGSGNPSSCMLLLNFLNNGEASIDIDIQRALYINFCMRNKHLKPGTEEFANALQSDVYYNCLKAKYGYAVTGHKCQGGEWRKVFIDYSGRTGMSDDCLRWAYTATTRAKHTLYVANLPHITPFVKFRIDPIQKCRNLESECRIIEHIEPTPFHADNKEDFLKAKYWCIIKNMEGTPYRVLSIMSKPYEELYYVQTPNGVYEFDIYYKSSGIFHPAIAVSQNQNDHTQQVLMLLNDERQFPFVFNYIPSDEIHEKLYNMIRSACDSLSIQITNVVEHPEDYTVVYYMRTSGTYSYIKVYINNNGFVTYAKPMSMLGTEDNELTTLLVEINNRFI